MAKPNTTPKPPRKLPPPAPGHRHVQLGSVEDFLGFVEDVGEDWLEDDLNAAKILQPMSKEDHARIDSAEAADEEEFVAVGRRVGVSEEAARRAAKAFNWQKAKLRGKFVSERIPE